MSLPSPFQSVAIRVWQCGGVDIFMFVLDCWIISRDAGLRRHYPVAVLRVCEQAIVMEETLMS